MTSEMMRVRMWKLCRSLPELQNTMGMELQVWNCAGGVERYFSWKGEKGKTRQRRRMKIDAPLSRVPHSVGILY
jgi:hypothetical protein